MHSDMQSCIHPATQQCLLRPEYIGAIKQAQMVLAKLESDLTCDASYIAWPAV